MELVKGELQRGAGEAQRARASPTGDREASDLTLQDGKLGLDYASGLDGAERRTSGAWASRCSCHR